MLGNTPLSIVPAITFVKLWLALQSLLCLSLWQTSLRFWQSNMNSAGKRAVIPQMPAWECLPSVQDFLGIFSFHLESFFEAEMPRLMGSLCRADSFIRHHLQTPGIVSVLCARIPDWCVLEVLFLHSAEDCHVRPAQHCAIAELLGSAAWVPWTSPSHVGCTCSGS